MEIDLGSILNYSTVRNILDQYLKKTLLLTDTEIVFDYSDVRQIEIPEILTILSWSTLLLENNKVSWKMPDPYSLPTNIDDLRFNIQNILGENKYNAIFLKLDKIKNDALQGRLYPRSRKLLITKIITDNTKEANTDKNFENWIKAETNSLKYLDLLGYMHRYDVFNRLQHHNIKIVSKQNVLPVALQARIEDSPCLEICNISTKKQLDDTIDRFINEDDLGAILGEYTNLGKFEAGSLTDIILNELGRNIIELEQNASGWICTRLVNKSRIKSNSVTFPNLWTSVSKEHDYLEVTISDNACGLISEIEEVYKLDSRNSIKNKYSEIDDLQNRERILLDYCFDRLSSTKRNISQLIHYESKESQIYNDVSSGLYWIWNVVKAQRGAICIQTNNVSGWYDFTDEKTITKIVEVEENKIPFPGTQVRIIFPLQTHGATSMVISKSKKDHNRKSSFNKPSFTVEWVGDFVKMREIIQNSRNQELFIRDDNPANILINRLHEKYKLVDTDGIFVLDLSGTRSKWIKAAIQPLIHFFVELNFTASTTSSTIILWNVPENEIEIFTNAININLDRKQHIKTFRRILLLISDTQKVYFIIPRASFLNPIFSVFEYDQELLISDILNTNTLEFTTEDLIKLLKENSHLFKLDDNNEKVLFRAWPPILSQAVWKSGEKWLLDISNKSVDNGGIKQAKQGYYFRLPTTGQLVRTFYSFGGILENYASSSRLCWMLAVLIREVSQNKKIDYFVSTTRSGKRLLKNIFQIIGGSISGNTELLVSDTVEELKYKYSGFNGTGIIITDVISSATLCNQIASFLPRISWSGTISILDTRDTIEFGISKTESSSPYPFNFYKSNPITTGNVFSLLNIIVNKVDPTEHQSERIISVDPINVLPVSQIPNSLVKNSIWKTLRSDSISLNLGHFKDSSSHHYIYYINPEALFDSYSDVYKKTLTERMLEFIQIQLNNCAQYDPDNTIIFHPPSTDSFAESIAEHMQKQTGILLRRAIYRDKFSEQKRFSPFVDYGNSTSKSIIIIIDDGSNSGETIMGMIESALRVSPQKIIVCIGLVRMSAHKLQFFSSLKNFKNLKSKIEIFIGGWFSVPVYSKESCPACKMLKGVEMAKQYSFIFNTYFTKIQKNTEAIDKRDINRQSKQLLLSDNILDIAQYREAIELYSFHEESSKTLNKLLNDVINIKSLDSDSLMNLITLINLEPDLLDALVFRGYLYKLTIVVIGLVGSSCNAQVKEPLIFIFHLIAAEIKITKNLTELKKQAILNSLIIMWKSIILENTGFEHDVNNYFALAVSYCFVDSKDSHNNKSFEIIFNSLLSALKEIGDQSMSVTHYGNLSLLSREIYSIYNKKIGSTITSIEKDPESLFSLASYVRSILWSHASNKHKSYITKLTKLDHEDIVLDNESTEFKELIRGSTQFFDLKHRLINIDNECRQKYTNSSEISSYWVKNDVHEKNGKYTQLLKSICSLLPDENNIESNLHNKTQLLSYLKELPAAFTDFVTSLSSGFSELFPTLDSTVVDVYLNYSDIISIPLGIEKKSVEEEFYVFCPRILIESFIRETIKNLETSAFNHWNTDDIENKGSAKIYYEYEKNNDLDNWITVVIQDNGPMQPDKTNANQTVSGDNIAINGLKGMVKYFDCDLEGPDTDCGITSVRLKVRASIKRGIKT